TAKTLPVASPARLAMPVPITFQFEPAPRTCSKMAPWTRSSAKTLPVASLTRLEMPVPTTFQLQPAPGMCSYTPPVAASSAKPLPSASLARLVIPLPTCVQIERPSNWYTPWLWALTANSVLVLSKATPPMSLPTSKLLHDPVGRKLLVNVPPFQIGVR